MSFSVADVIAWLESRGWTRDPDLTNTQYPWIPPGGNAPGVYGMADAMSMQFNLENNGQVSS